MPSHSNLGNGKVIQTTQTTNSATNRQDGQTQRANLDGRYGKIGISAVAAAVRFQSGGETRQETRSLFTLRDSD
jgi:hypothetical protein